MTSRPSISWSDLAGADVGLWGLGVEGAANLRKLRALGGRPVLVDDAPAAPELDGLAVLATAEGGAEALALCEAVVKTPGISRRRPEVAALQAAGVPVVGGLGLWLEEVDRATVAVITGTKGKSTTAALAGHLLTGLGRRAEVAGNIGRPPWDPDLAGDHDLWVVEVSSFQATDLSCSPPVVAVTSLAPDHLDWHGDVESYYKDKLSACTQPGARLTIADGDSPALRAHAGLLGPEVRWVSAADPALHAPWVSSLGLLGEHNARNAGIARAIVEAVMGAPVDDGALAAAAPGFASLQSRLEPLAAIGGAEFVDDSLATNVLPTLAAVETFGGRRLALIVGGHDRGIDYGPLATGLVARPDPTLVLTVPDNGPLIGQALRRAIARTPSAPVEVRDCADVADAVRSGFAWASPDGVVLLSPAAPSFGQFRDYRERSDAFRRAAAACAPAAQTG